MATANLTEDFVRKLKVPEGKLDVVVFDEKLPGFGVRKYAKGHACYFVKYSIRGKSKKHTLGRVVAGNLQAMRLSVGHPGQGAPRHRCRGRAKGSRGSGVAAQDVGRARADLSWGAREGRRILEQDAPQDLA